MTQLKIYHSCRRYYLFGNLKNDKCYL